MLLSQMTNEQLAEVEQDVQQAAIARNNISAGEFVKFLPLYQKGGGNISEQRFADLSIEFGERFNRFAHITVFADEDHTQKIAAIPPQLTPVPTMDDAGLATNIDSVIRATSRKGWHPGYATVEQASQKAAGALDRALDNTEQEEEQYRVWSDTVSEHEESEDEEFEWED